MTIEIGESGNKVRDLQAFLVTQKFLKENQVDGDFGPKTLRAVANFQKKNGLNDSGEVDNTTFDVMIKLGFKSTEPPPVKIPEPVTTTISYKLRQKLLDLARKEVGVKEVGGANKGPRIRTYQRATWLEGTGWPWCAAFICFIMREWLKDKEVDDYFKFTPEQAEEFRPKTAGAWDFINWAKSRKDYGVKVLTDSDDPRAGDIVVFDISHIGIVESDNDHGTMWTIEGNTDPSGGRDGDGVYRRQRNQKEARAFLRIL